MKDLAFEESHGSQRRERITILIAGGGGFLGSHLCEKLLGEGNRIICVDNFQTGSRRNVAPFIENPDFSLIEQDVCIPLKIKEPVNQIYNMACAASPPSYQQNPIHTLMTNIIGAKNLLDLARRKGARILQSSTSEIYGDPEIPLQVESYNGNVNTCGPRACYDEGKRAAETLFWEYNELYGVQTRVARIFNTYGPRMHPKDGRVVSNFIVQALEGENLTIYGDGSQTRSFCFVSDMVDGLVRLMASNETMPVNIGNPDEFTILDLAKIVQRKTLTRSRIEFTSLPKDDPRQRRPDIGRAAAVLDWAPKVSLDEGLDHMIAWFREELIGPRLTDALVQ